MPRHARDRFHEREERVLEFLFDGRSVQHGITSRSTRAADRADS